MPFFWHQLLEVFMTRLTAGLLTGIIGALVIILISFVSIFNLCTSILAIFVGLAAGLLVGRNPSFARRAGGAGALAGLIAGLVLLVGQFIGGIILFNQPQVVDVLTHFQQTVIATTPTLQPGSGDSTTQPSIESAVSFYQSSGVIFSGLCLGLVNVLLAVGLGAAGGKIRETSAPPPEIYPQSSPYSSQGTSTYGDTYPPGGDRMPGQ
jgi:hypothetical protein